ncbi:ABC transporter ATP-binding protein/permease [Brevibacterium sp. 50QC2O2]|uniref:ABC transporter ATP-binding protein n=1 Tax=Brevibacterium TaxID=1696 RepID=UPI00211CBA0F|nr:MULTISPECIES: ABC transporter ATP-binding protein [unclassified Brevibacterium]MCQ9384321.1 ABC transporter ATP-binding protein/permease [Brevibacterium sp. 68QC2CO]MCQ9388940.1 ABC transporter ATP-binding protein/permease [Brevibacterium sp. 50QC2O2]
MLIRLFRHYLRPYVPAVIVLLLFQLLQVLGTLYLPTLNAGIVDRGITAGDTATVWRYGGLMLAVAAGQVVANIVAIVAGAHVAMRAAADIRRDFFTAVMGFGARETGHFGTSSLVTRSTNDVRQVQQFLVMGMSLMIMAPIMALGGLAMALAQDLRLSWVILVTVVVLLVIMLQVVRKMVPSFRAMQERLDSLGSVLSQQLGGLRVIRAFGKQSTERDRFQAANEALTGTNLYVGKLFVVLFPAVMTIVNAGAAAVVWFGARQVQDGTTQVGVVMAFIQYLMLILMGVMMVTFLAMMIPRAEVAAGRLVDVLETTPQMDRDSGTVESLPDPGAIEFSHVTFRYPGAQSPVLTDVSFTVDPGTTTAVIGATGSGKSTLVQLLVRLADPDSGRVAIGGVDVAAIAPQTLGRQFGYVPQQPHVFGASVRDNLRTGAPDAPESDLAWALAVSRADEFVSTFPDGLDHPINQGGTNLSGGQRQRLAIAMALVRRCPILVFDDSFSALDAATDAAVRSALDHEVEATKVIVTQRVAAAIDADQVVVLDDGHVVGLGTHDQLMDSCGVYQEIVSSQLNEEAR